ncbi:hypothetical protein ACVBEH_21160 [Roseateles sp. GG27B]
MHASGGRRGPFVSVGPGRARRGARYHIPARSLDDFQQPRRCSLVAQTLAGR